jgi:hypothetical protein
VTRKLGLCLTIIFPFLLIAFDAEASEPLLACDGSEIPVGEKGAPFAPIPRDAPLDRAPVPVQVGMQITELNQIDERTSSFRFEGFGDFQFCDPRSAFDPVAAGRKTRRIVGIHENYPIWNVKLHVANGLGAVEVTQRLVEIQFDGSVQITGYFNSRVASAFDLRLFPFDRQALVIYVESFNYNNRLVELVSRDDLVSISDDVYLTEWHFEGIRTHVETATNPRERTPFSRVVISIDVAREWGYYLFKLWIPLSLIVALSWSVFWMPAETLANRIRLASTAFLTIVAYQFSISGSLPKVAYLTLMDQLMIGSFILIALSALESMICVTTRDKHPKFALGLDRRARRIMPMAYLGGLGAMWLIYAH